MRQSHLNRKARPITTSYPIHISRRLNIEIQAIYGHKKSGINLYINSVDTRRTIVIATQAQLSA
jgi:hypothetical protein